MPSNVEFPYPENFFDDDLPKGVLSPSGINSYLICPKRFYHSYILGIRKPPGIAAAKGKALHFGAEITHKHTLEHGIPMELEEATDLVAQQFDIEVEDIDEADKNNEEMPVGQVKDRTLYNFKVLHTVALPLMNPIAVEKPVAFFVGSVPVRGIIDLIDLQPEERDTDTHPDSPDTLVRVVADLKTTKKKWTDQQVQFTPQFTLYAIAENTKHVRADLLVDGKKSCKYTAMRAVRSDNEKRIITEDVEEVASNIKKGIFPRCDPTSWVCITKWCGYYADCRGPK